MLAALPRGCANIIGNHHATSPKSYFFKLADDFQLRGVNVFLIVSALRRDLGQQSGINPA
ncbi:MAG: hypothetical protein HRU71_11245 [Planctomycetia bacterium]|nr:MAG: hypothetical protein HRU71_11245 [Planctomycetia bacterium]RIK71721.1 MAG: hypothetical protein DCC66_00315 [Planctomycetota bacterium]